MIHCKFCHFCECDDISSTRSEFRKGDDLRYFCTYYNRVVYEYDSCRNAR